MKNQEQEFGNSDALSRWVSEFVADTGHRSDEKLERGVRLLCLCPRELKGKRGPTFFLFFYLPSLSLSLWNMMKESISEVLELFLFP